MASTSQTGKLDAFTAPAGLKDFNATTLKEWSTMVDGWMNAELKRPVDQPREGGPGKGPVTQFFNPMHTDHDLSQKGVVVSWIAFPAEIGAEHPDNEERWKIADNARENNDKKGTGQDEYCEWSVNRDSNHRITDVTLTCEGPEYWEHFVKHQPQDAVAEIERMNNIKGVKVEELLDSEGKYNPKNKYNISTTGPIIHLIHWANSLQAEVGIVSQATTLREKGGKPVTDKYGLINCAKYGGAERNSDPEIGYRVNGFARDKTGYKISIKNPVGLYFQNIQKGNFQLNYSGDEEDKDLRNVPDKWFESVRGDINKSQGLRLRISNTTGEKVTGAKNKGRLLDVTDIWDTEGGAFVKYGAQFTDHMSVGVAAITTSGQVGVGYSCNGTARSVMDAKVPMSSIMSINSVEDAPTATTTYRSRY